MSFFCPCVTHTFSVLAPTVFVTRNIFFADSRISSCVIGSDKKPRVTKRQIEVFGPKRAYERPCVTRAFARCYLAQGSIAGTFLLKLKLWASEKPLPSDSSTASQGATPCCFSLRKENEALTLHGSLRKKQTPFIT